MNLKHTPKIVANNSNNNKKPYEKPEVKFENKQQMQAYLVDSVTKNKRKNFNVSVKLT